ncbi:MAG: sulfatase-like hydrolase/transferase, partial [Candidatus Aenigmarchaeota archaeon]|nr:sulfatase-like hydrolase/transferase [Candidatus Aenigmarchaeota archaeon]
FTLLDMVRDRRRPFFLFINYMDAHWPYIPPRPFDKLYPGKIKRFTTERYGSLINVVLQQKRKMTKQEYSHLLSQYDGAITYIDFHIAKLTERLKKLGKYQNSIIIITSDHGEAFGERDLIGHGVSVYQDQIHIPLIIKYPNSREKAIVNKLVSLVDLMPTLLTVLDYEIPARNQGQSLKVNRYKEIR